MYLDFDHIRPDTPTIPRAISVREGVLLSLVAHLVAVIVLLVAPDWLPRATPAEFVPAQQDESLRFIDAAAINDRRDIPVRPADISDQDRRATTRERAPESIAVAPLSRGNTLETREAAPDMRAAGQPDASASAIATPVPDSPEGPALSESAAPVAASEPPRPVSGNLGQSLRDLRQYLQNENYDNPQGGAIEQGADIQFDSKGVDFGPWLQRFKRQIERNWFVPQAAMTMRGRVVVQFHVLRNGTIVGMTVVQASGIPAFATAAVNALKLSNPTTSLPPEYPTDNVFFTVTFHYNERP